MAAEPPNECAVVRDTEMSRYRLRGWEYLGRLTKPAPGSRQEDFDRWLTMQFYVWMVR